LEAQLAILAQADRQGLGEPEVAGLLGAPVDYVRALRQASKEPTP
jgi:hypothetical protein